MNTAVGAVKSEEATNGPAPSEAQSAQGGAFAAILAALGAAALPTPAVTENAATNKDSRGPKALEGVAAPAPASAKAPVSTQAIAGASSAGSAMLPETAQAEEGLAGNGPRGGTHEGTGAGPAGGTAGEDLAGTTAGTPQAQELAAAVTSDGADPAAVTTASASSLTEVRSLTDPGSLPGAASAGTTRTSTARGQLQASVGPAGPSGISPGTGAALEAPTTSSATLGTAAAAAFVNPLVGSLSGANAAVASGAGDARQESQQAALSETTPTEAAAAESALAGASIVKTTPAAAGSEGAPAKAVLVSAQTRATPGAAVPSPFSHKMVEEAPAAENPVQRGQDSHQGAAAATESSTPTTINRDPAPSRQSQLPQTAATLLARGGQTTTAAENPVAENAVAENAVAENGAAENAVADSGTTRASGGPDRAAAGTTNQETDRTQAASAPNLAAGTLPSATDEHEKLVGGEKSGTTGPWSGDANAPGTGANVPGTGATSPGTGATSPGTGGAVVAMSPVMGVTTSSAPANAGAQATSAAPNTGAAQGDGAKDAPLSTQLATALAPTANQREGSYQVNIRLQPEELGVVHVEVHLEAGTINVQLHAEGDATRDMLRQNLGQLRQEMAATGLSTGHFDVGDGSGPGANGAPPSFSEEGLEPVDEEPGAQNAAATTAALAREAANIPQVKNGQLDMRL